MTRPDPIATLRGDLQPTEPDPVLLAQLVELSRVSAPPAARPGRSVGARIAIVLGGAIAVGATSWAAGALPGTDSPFAPEEHVTHRPADPPSSDPTGPEDLLPADPLTSPPTGAPGVGTTPDGSAVPGTAPPDGTPPVVVPPAPTVGVPPDVPSLPPAPDLPEVPTFPTPGLGDIFPTPSIPAASLPAMPRPDALATAPSSGDDNSDSGTLRSPRPQEEQVARAR